MELRDFIKSTILDIMDGVKDAQDCNYTTAIINAEPGDGTRDMRTTAELHFDISIMAMSNGESGRGIGVASPLFEGGFRWARKIENRSESRVQFQIPVLFPKFNKIGPSQDAEG